MSRAVVFETKGKLDLRAITVFGLNAKPGNVSPIGYFGTGLKYAVAILARTQHAVSFHIGDQKWSITSDQTKFRDQSFQALSLVRHRKLLPPKFINLPFTTKLGQNWELWQAFRELYSNTLDEGGDAYIIEVETPHNYFGDVPNLTRIIVEGEDFVQEFLDRAKTFLPEGERQRSKDPIQIINRPSKCIYYRGIRVLDLEKHSVVTYNILTQTDLTEDRTISEFDAKWAIERYVASEYVNSDVIKVILDAPDDTYEGDLTFNYLATPPSDIFLGIVSTAARPQVQHNMKAYLPQKKQPTFDSDDEFFTVLINAINNNDRDLTWMLISRHKQLVLDKLAIKESVHDTD